MILHTVNRQFSKAAKHSFTRFGAIFVFCIASGGLSIAQTSIPDSVQQSMQRAMQARQQQIETLKQGIVRVEAQKEVVDTGTGIVLSASPESIRILTALHVVDGARSVNVVFYGDRVTPVPARKLAQQSDTLDLAILEVTPGPGVRMPGEITPYRFRNSSLLQIGEQVWSANGEWVPVPNTITRLDHEADTRRFEYTAVSVGRGFSGGPILDNYGNIIGMHDALTGDKHFAVGIKIDSAFQTLDALGVNTPKATDSLLGSSGPQGAGTGDPRAQAASRPAMTMSDLTVNGTLQPKDAPSSQVAIRVTPDAGNATFTALLMGGGSAVTFTKGVASDEGRTLTFSSIQRGMVVFGSTYLQLSGGSLNLKLVGSSTALVSLEQGNVSGSFQLTGSAVQGRKVFGRMAPNGPPTTIQGDIIGTYVARLVPKTPSGTASQ